MDFFKNKISLENKEELESFLNGFPHETSGLSFSSIYMWSREYTYTYEIIEDYLCIAGLSNFENEEEAPFLFPLLPREGRWEKEKLRYVFDLLIQRFSDIGKPFVMRLVPENLRKIYEEAMPERFVFIDDPSNADYIHLTEDLAALRGKRFHGKKNHLNRFNTLYASECKVVPMSSSMTEEALELVKCINQVKEVSYCERLLLDGELEMMQKILPDFERIGLEGVAIRIGGKLQAFAFGGRLGDDTIVEHVEKANVAYTGIYQKLNNEFCRAAERRYRYVNREEDMGLEGLRKSKMSYKPLRLVEKQIMLLQGDEKALECYGNPY